MAEDIKNMMQELQLTFEQAATVLHIEPEQYPLYKKVMAKL